MAVVRAIEEGESSWSSNFQLLEVLVMGDQPKTSHKSSKPIFDTNTESKDIKKVLFCKKYQSDECHAELKYNAHWGTLGENLTCCTMCVQHAFLNVRSLSTIVRILLIAHCPVKIDK